MARKVSDIRIKPVWILGISGVVLLAITLTMLTFGTLPVPLSTVIAVMLKRLVGIGSHNVAAVHEIIVWNIRWQRVALAILVGSGLAVSGVCYQTLFKNPLADSFILGVSSGAALGAALAIVTHYTQYTMVFAFAGGVMSLALVYLFSRRHGRIHSTQLLLAGIACGSMLNAILSSIMALNAHQMSAIVFWLMGSLANYHESLVYVTAVVASGLAVAMAYARDLDVMTLGDENALFLGVDVDKVKAILLISTTLMTAAVVSVSGIIGFVGLIVPHMARTVTGPEHWILLPLSAIWGAVFLLLADGIIRTTALVAGIPIGVVTALVGSPFFLYILYSTGRRLQ